MPEPGGSLLGGGIDIGDFGAPGVLGPWFGNEAGWVALPIGD